MAARTYATSADDDLAVHEGVDLAVVAEGALLLEADRDRVAGLDPVGVESAVLGGRVGHLRRVGEDDLGAAGDVQRLRMELEVVDDHLYAVLGGAAPRRCGSCLDDGEGEGKREAREKSLHGLSYGKAPAEVQSLCEKSTAATEVARLRLDTPSRIGMPKRASARSSSSALSP